MESRAKQRLTGAVILVALFVLLVPELLTGPGDAHPTADNSSDEGLRRYTIDLDAQDGSGQPMAPASNEAPVALPEVATPMTAPPEAATPATPAAAPAPAPQPAAPVTANPMAPTNNIAAPARRA